MALGPDGLHAEYTNFCGPLPSDWNAARWGRHYCLAAPGTLNAVGHRGQGDAPQLGIEGTSFAAPLVSGGLALLMEQFRGQLGNDRIVRRLIDTADHSGPYESLEIYGAGVMDLRAALAPVGRVRTGTSQLSAVVQATQIEAPSAFGGLGERFAANGVEIAGLDDWGAPFWHRPQAFISPLGLEADAIPRFASGIAPYGQTGGTELHLGFTPDTFPVPLGSGRAFLAGEDRIGYEQARSVGWHWGALVDRGSWLGGRPSGAFGDGLRTITAWVGRDAEADLASGWRVKGRATMALVAAAFEDDAMLEVDPAMLSSWRIGIEHGDPADEQWWRVSLSQPPRAETGRASLTYLAGLAEGEPVYRSASARLAPNGRMLEVALQHERELGLGRLALQIAHAVDAGHREGESTSRVGIAFRLDF